MRRYFCLPSFCPFPRRRRRRNDTLNDPLNDHLPSNTHPQPTIARAIYDDFQMLEFTSQWKRWRKQKLPHLVEQERAGVETWHLKPDT